MQLFVRKSGSGHPLIIMHGLYGCSDNWLHVARALSEDFTVYCVDLRNHGRSPHDNVHTYKTMAEDILELMQTEQLDAPVLLGHSMGGKVTMCLLSHHPELFRAAVIADIAPVSYTSLTDYSEHTLAHLNMMNAMMSVPLDQLHSREEADRMLAEAVPEKRTRLFLLKSLYLDAEGRFSWRLNLPVLARHLPHILGGTEDFGPLPNPSLTCPVLFLKGGNSDYINPDNMPLLHRAFPDARLQVIQDAGHWLHFEQPERFVEATRNFLLHK